LITCGCVETLSDTEWIKEELYHFHDDPKIKLLNLNYLKNKTTSIFGKEQIIRLMGSAKNKTEKIAQESLLAGGQRLRPFFAVLAYEAFVKEPDPSVLNLLALSVECFHKASLIHDDIEDNDDIRYGKETLHSQHGVPVAINTGDYLIGEGYLLIAESPLPANIIRDSIKVISRGHTSLSIGQGTELLSLRSGKILSLEEMLRVFENKTAAAFKVSLLLGAIVGGADAEILDSLSNFSKSIGIAYQVKDDLSDFNGSKGDIEVRKFSILLSLLKEAASAADSERLNQALKKGDFEIIYDLIKVYDIHEKTLLLLSSYLIEARNCLENFSNLGLKLALHEILGKTFKEYI
jgi:geranylgeranyl diphosphate synthase, type II